MKSRIRTKVAGCAILITYIYVSDQIRDLCQGCHLLVATPGRLVDLPAAPPEIHHGCIGLHEDGPEAQGLGQHRSAQWQLRRCQGGVQLVQQPSQVEHHSGNVVVALVAVSKQHAGQLVYNEVYLQQIKKFKVSNQK